MTITINQLQSTATEIFTFGSNQAFKYSGSKGNNLYVITANQSGNLTINDAKGLNTFIFQENVAIQSVSYNQTKNQVLLKTDQKTITINNASEQRYTESQLTVDKFVTDLKEKVNSSSKKIYFFPKSTIDVASLLASTEFVAKDISIKGLTTNDIFTFGSSHNVTVTDTKGNEHYYISQYQKGNITISDKVGSNVIHFDENIVFKTVVYDDVSNLLKITLSNGGVISVLSANTQSYTLNGNDTTLINNIDALVSNIKDEISQNTTTENNTSENGNSSNSNTSGTASTETQSLTGRIVDGAIQNALVFIDANGNKKFDSGEYFTKSNDDGYFTFKNLPVNAKQGQFISIGGTDTATKLPISYVLKGTFGSKVLTPIATLIIELSESQNISLADAQALLKSKLNLSTQAKEVDLLTYDPTANSIEDYKPSKTSAKVAIELQGLSIKIGNIMSHMTSIIEGADRTNQISSQTAFNESLNNLAKLISTYSQTSNSTSLFEDQQFIEQLLLSITEDTNLTLSTKAKTIIQKDIYSVDNSDNTVSFLVRTLLKLNSDITNKINTFNTKVAESTNINDLLAQVLNVWNELIVVQALGQNQLPLAVIHTIHELLINPNLTNLMDYLQPYLNDAIADGTSKAGLSLKITSGNQDNFINQVETSQDLTLKLTIDNPDQLVEGSSIYLMLDGKIISNINYKITQTDLANKAINLTIPKASLNWGDDGSKVLKLQITLPNGNVGSFKPTLNLTLDTNAPISPNVTKTDGSIALNNTDITSGFETKIMLSEGSVVGDSIDIYVDNSSTVKLHYVLTQADINNGYVLQKFTANEVKNFISVTLTDLAGNTSSKGQIMLSEISATPKVPQLATGQDTGKSTSDNITKIYKELKFTGNYPVQGATITLIDETTKSVLGTATVTDPKANWTITSSKALADGVHNVIVQATELNKQPTNSSPLLLTIDTLIPTPKVTKIDGSSVFVQSDIKAGFQIKIANLPSDIDKIYLYGDDGVTQVNAYTPTATDIANGYYLATVGVNIVTTNLSVKFIDIAGNESTKGTMRLGDNPTGIDHIIELNQADESGERKVVKGHIDSVDEFRAYFNSNKNADATVGDFISKSAFYDIIDFGTEDRLHFYDESTGKKIATIEELETFSNVANDFKNVELSFAGTENSGLIINMVGVATSYYSTLSALEASINPLATNLYIN